MSDSRTSRRDLLRMATAGTATMSLAGLLRAGEAPSSHPTEKMIVADFSKEIGRIKPLHGVCNGPINWGGRANLTLFHREAGFPHVRIHDVDWPGTTVVDIPAIFETVASLVRVPGVTRAGWPMFSPDAERREKWSWTAQVSTLRIVQKVSHGSRTFRHPGSSDGAGITGEGVVHSARGEPVAMAWLGGSCTTWAMLAAAGP